MSLPNSPYSHELGVRTLLSTLQSCATRNKRYIEPLMSCSIDFYCRVFVRVKSKASEVKKSASQSAIVYHCYACKNFKTQFMGKYTETETQKGGLSVKHAPGAGPPVDRRCEFCEGVFHIGGPFYGASMHHRVFIDTLLFNLAHASSKQYGTYDRMIGMVSLISEELDLPFYYNLPTLSNTLHCVLPPMDDIISGLLNGNYKVSETHMQPGCIKTDAPLQFLWDLLKQWCSANRPIQVNNLKTGSPAFKIYQSPKQFDIDFTLHTKARPSSKKFKMVRYQANPTPNWGPKSRPKKRKHDDHHPLEETLIEE